MGITPGTRIGSYEVIGLIGAGGMGEVYRARDTKLGRDVAIKVLPEAFVGDSDRLARFQREAHVLASLNHPNIAHIYGLEESDRTRCIVMELVDGQTLAAALKHGPLHLDEALQIATQIAEALDAAHEKGIIHRDLKPSNVMVLPGGKVKVLDFGLAKSLDTAPASSTFSNSPTLSMAATNAGVILGTAAYMSPEQVRGKAVDKRADIWAFGCVLYEMLTGRQAFSGEETTDILASIVQGEPKWDALPASTPAKIRQLLVRCLTKDPARRLRDIGDGRIEIDDARHSPAEPERKRHLPLWLRWAIAAGVVLIAAAIGFSGWMQSSSSRDRSLGPSIRFSISPPKGWHIMEAPIAQEIAISPDNKHVAFTVAADTGDTWGVAVRAIEAVDAELLPGTEGGRSPFWSPDSRYLGFFINGKVKRIEVSSGALQTICDTPNIGKATWGSIGTILLDPGNLFSVPASGGKPEPITSLDSNHNESAHSYPYFLPDGRHFFYSIWQPSEPMRTIIGTLDSKQVMPVLTSDSGVQYAAGHLFSIHAGKLMAQQFDERKLQLIGEAVRLVEPVWINPIGNYPGFGVSTDFVAFGAGNMPDTQLVWLDRAGKEAGLAGLPDKYVGVSISPRETEAAVTRFDPKSRTFDIWIMNLAGGTPSRLTFDPSTEDLPVWSPNGESIVFNQQGRSINMKQASGATQAETILKQNTGYLFPSSWSMDGRYIAYTTQAVSGGDIGLLPMSADKKPVTLLHGPFDHSDPMISPNSKWMAYASNESGRFEINVVSFPKPEGKWQISVNGGTRPRWRRDGKELFFLSPAGQLMAVEVNGGGATFQKGVPKVLFNVPGPRMQGWFYNYDVAQNGQRFLFNKILESSEPPAITVISNWQALLK